MKKKENKEKVKTSKTKEVKNKKTKKQTKAKVKKESFATGVKNELKKVKWPDKKYIIKYSVVTVVFVIALSVFFYLISALMSFLKVWLG